MDPLYLLLLGVVVVIGGIVWLRLHPFVALLAAALSVALLTPVASLERTLLAQQKSPAEARARAADPVGNRLAAKFGSACGNLGLLIALASVVGACLLHSGGAERIVRSALQTFGEKQAPLVLALSGLILGVSVFFDTVFLLLIPIARALAARTGRDYLLYVLAIAVGTTMTHSLVPPTPGPLFAATTLKVDIGLMMLAGLALSTLTAGCGLAYASWANRRWPTEPRAISGASADLAAPHAALRDEDLPPLVLALAPIALPVILISSETFSDLGLLPAAVMPVTALLGHPNIALALAAGIALFTLATRPGLRPDQTRRHVQAALADGGTILLITAAGGVFGSCLQDTGVGERLKELAQAHAVGVLPLAFVITALVRVAQGSATVAMVTSVGIVGPLATPETLGCHPVYLALTIGCASKLVPWMNDSGFWVLSRSAGLSERETLRTMSVMFALMGVTGFLLILIAARLLPLV
ncbi:MAG: GntP family permease [Opitutaceae bacterium]